MRLVFISPHTVFAESVLFFAQHKIENWVMVHKTSLEDLNTDHVDCLLIDCLDYFDPANRLDMSVLPAIENIHIGLIGRPELEAVLPKDIRYDIIFPTHLSLSHILNDLKELHEGVSAKQIQSRFGKTADYFIPDFSSLSPREAQVLRYLMDGASNKEIANMLTLELVTIKMHVRGICKKLGVDNRTRAALLAQKWGFAKE